MEFPDFGLVQLSPRDFTGPGVEMFCFKTDASSGGALTATFTLPGTELSSEHLYLGRFSGFLVPAAGNFPQYLTITRQMPDTRILWATTLPAPHTLAMVKHITSDFFVVPGGKDMLFAGTFSGAGVQTLAGSFWGYRFPKGNVLGL